MKGYNPYTGKDRWGTIDTVLLVLTLIAGCFCIAYIWALYSEAKPPEPGSSGKIIWYAAPPVSAKPDTGAQYTLTIEDAMRRIDRHNADVREQY